MPFGPRPACALSPAHLTVPHTLEGHGRNNVVNNVPRKHDAIARFFDEIADDEIVGEIFSGGAVTTDFRHGVLARDDCWSKPELHSFEQIRGDDAGRHFNGHADGIHGGPETTSVFATVDAGE